MTYPLLPSAAKAFVEWAEAHAALAALHGGRVGTRLAAALPAVRVQRVGGIAPDPWLDEPLLQVECWAASEGAADDLARTFVAALPDFRGTLAGGRVHTAQVESGPYWSPDDPKLSTSARYILTIRLVTTSS